MGKIKKQKEIIERGVWVICHCCGTEYLENKSWVIADFITECPICGAKLGVGEKGEVLD